MESPEGGDRRAEEEAEPVPQKKQKATNPAVVLNSLKRIHAIMAFWEACHGLHRPVLPTPQLSRKSELQSKTDGSWPDSQQRAWTWTQPAEDESQLCQAQLCDLGK